MNPKNKAAIKVWLVAALALTFCSIAVSEEVKGLYDASIPVMTQNQSDRNSDFSEALKDVLVKVSGDAFAVESSGIERALKEAHTLVQSFSYGENPDYVSPEELKARELASLAQQAETPLNETLSTDTVQINEQSHLDGQGTTEIEAEDFPEEPFLLDVSFAKQSVDALLSKYSIPVWGNVRPSLMLWVASESSGERILVGSQDETLGQPLLKEAKEVGLPVFLPVVDLEDLVLVDLNDLWGLYPSAIEKAKIRYRSDINVLVKLNIDEFIEQSSDQSLLTPESGAQAYSAEWLILGKSRQITTTTSASTLDELWEQMLAKISSKLAQRFAVLEGAEYVQPGIKIEVSNVQSFSDYARLGQYLSELPVLDSVKTLWVKGDKVLYQVDLKGGQDRFLEFLEIGGKLKHSPSIPYEEVPATYIGPRVPDIQEGGLLSSQGLGFETSGSFVTNVNEPERFIWLGE